MMKKKTENKFNLAKQLILLPILALLVMGLSAREVKTQIKITSENQSTVPEQKSIKNDKLLNIAADEFTKAQNNAKKDYFVSGKVTDSKGNPISGVAIIIKGKTIGTVTDSEGNYELKMEDEAETLDFIMVGYEKKETEAKAGKKLNVQLQADKNQNKDSVKVIGYALPPGDLPQVKIRAQGSLSGEPSLVVVDGKEYKSMEEANITPEEIDNITVLKNESATKLYGEKAKNGVIIIETKENSDNEELGKKIIEGLQLQRSLEGGGKPLIVVDGKELNSVEEANIPTEGIDNITVLKSKEATKLYGEKAKDGAIIIKTRKK